MDLNRILQMITPEVHLNLRHAIETGKWADGNRLTDEQRALCMQAVIAWEAQHLSVEARIGYIDRGSKQPDDRCDAQDVEPELIRIVRAERG